MPILQAVKQASEDTEVRSIQRFGTQADIFPDAKPEKTCVCHVDEILWFKVIGF